MRKGVILAATAYFIWGMFPLYFKFLQQVPSLEMLLYRVFWSLLFLALVLAIKSHWTWIRTEACKPAVLKRFALSALLLSTNWLIYIWAVNNGHIVEASLGYFITPLINILLGMLFLKERMRPFQWVAIGLATLGVIWLGWNSGQFPWIGISLALSFGSYGLLRKTSSLGALEGLSLETALMFPIAFCYLGFLILQGNNSLINLGPSEQILIVLSGPITAIPLVMFAAGARRIPLSTMGLLQYISPSTQFILGVWVYQEHFDHSRLLGFICIWTALIAYTAESIWVGMRRQ